MVQDFKTAGKKTLELLKERLGFDLWMITRTEDDVWGVQSASNNGAGFLESAIQNWQETIRAKIVSGDQPFSTPEIGLISDQPDSSNEIGAYVCVPLTNGEGNFLGTMCAVHLEPSTDKLAQELALIELMANLLGSILDSEMKTQEAVRRAERAEAEATRDALTGLYNRLGWTQLIQQEESRCQRYNYPACVINIDLDGLKELNDTQGHAAGDQLLIQCGQALMEATRTSDIVARLGGDEFCVLGVQCDPNYSKVMEKRIRDCLAKAGVDASVGLAMRDEQGLAAACADADEKMYREKRAKKNFTPSGNHLSKGLEVA